MDSLLWYATRAAGMVSLVMLTTVVCLGLLTVTRWQREGWPRFLTVQLHNNLALLSIVFALIHIVIAVLDPYVSLGVASALLPFSSSYRWFWLGLGGVSMYLTTAVIVTSIVRGMLGRRAWRAVHWLAYAAWPLAVAHGLGTGTDAPAAWALALNGACIAAVVGALAWRVLATRSARLDLESALPQSGGRVP
jgi:predicted ferric reductase